MPKFGTKNARFRYFWAGTWKQYCHIWNQHPGICLIAKSRGKTKMPKFGTKNAWFGYFGPEICKQSCHIWNEYPRIFLMANFGGKKPQNLGPKMPYLSILGLEFF